MRRLLSMLRQSQNLCTETECFSTTGLPESCDVSFSSDFLMTCLMIAFIVVMYAFRPNSLRQLRSDNTTERKNGHDSTDDPPTPPSTAH